MFCLPQSSKYTIFADFAHLSITPGILKMEKLASALIGLPPSPKYCWSDPDIDCVLCTAKVCLRTAKLLLSNAKKSIFINKIHLSAISTVEVPIKYCLVILKYPYKLTKYPTLHEFLWGDIYLCPRTIHCVMCPNRQWRF